MTYAVQMECKEALNADKKLVTEEGKLVWLCTGEWGVECCSSYNYAGDVPTNVVEFDTEVAAHKYMETFKGAPWYYKPNGKYKVFKLNPVYKQVFDYWEISE